MCLSENNNFDNYTLFNITEGEFFEVVFKGQREYKIPASNGI